MWISSAVSRKHAVRRRWRTSRRSPISSASSAATKARSVEFGRGLGDSDGCRGAMRCKCYWVDSIAWTCPTAAYLWRSRVARTFVFEVRGLCFDDACSAALTPEYSFTLDPRQSATENRSERKGTTELRHGAGMQHRGRRHQL